MLEELMVGKRNPVTVNLTKCLVPLELWCFLFLVPKWGPRHQIWADFCSKCPSPTLPLSQIMTWRGSEGKFAYLQTPSPQDIPRHCVHQDQHHSTVIFWDFFEEVTLHLKKVTWESTILNVTSWLNENSISVCFLNDMFFFLSLLLKYSWFTI